MHPSKSEILLHKEKQARRVDKALENSDLLSTTRVILLEQANNLRKEIIEEVMEDERFIKGITEA